MSLEPMRTANLPVGRRRCLTGSLLALAAPFAGPTSRRLAAAAAAIAAPSLAVASTSTPVDSFGARAEIAAFVDEMASRHGFERAALLRSFSQARSQEKVLQLMNPPPRTAAARKVWRDYRARFIEPVRIERGVEFRARNDASLRLASALYGVPPDIIVAIIGIETVYGRHTGDFRVLESLATLAFDSPNRPAYFRAELEQFLLYVRENGMSPLEPRGSYAGAIGIPQFMPGSIRRFAVDFDRDGRIDLRASETDAIGSVASFLKMHGWAEGEPTHFGVAIDDPAGVGPTVDAGPLPSFTPAQLAERGIRPTEPVPDAMKLVLVDLPEGDAPTRYVLGANNFYAITRYNRSYFYAMSVIELAAAIDARRARTARAN
ncbi:MAG: lytic murein transglycosylase B [Lautropia sp.]